MYYVPTFFQPFELVPKEFYETFKDFPRRIWSMFDSRTLFTGDAIRRRYGKMIANEYSQHKRGAALDLVPVETAVEEIREDIKKRRDLLFKYITCIEEGVSWLHFDCRNHKGLLIVRP